MLFNLIDKNCARILILFTASPGRNHTRKEIQEWTELNNVPLDTSLNKLLFFKLVNEKKKIYSLNLESEIVQKLIEEKRIFINLPFKVQFILLKVVENLSRYRQIKNIILFGSYSKLIFTDRSDVDLAIILDNKIKYKLKLEKLIFSVVNKISKEFEKKVQCHYFIEDDLKHKEDPMIKDILRNGKELV